MAQSSYQPLPETTSHGNVLFAAPHTPGFPPSQSYAEDTEPELTELYNPFDTHPSPGQRSSYTPLLPKGAGQKDKRRPRPLTLSKSLHHKTDSEAFNPYNQTSPPSAQRTPKGIGRNGFERPNWYALAVHLAFCTLAWPVLYIFVLIARDNSLFMVRLIVGVGCGLVGSVLGLSLLGLAQRYLEASTWATIIHQSHSGDLSGVRLRDLESHSGDPTSALIALRVLWNRWLHTGTARSSRNSYDKRPWSLFILFFLFVVSIAASGIFALGRIVTIETNTFHQNLTYTEIRIKGDLSDTDIQRARDLIPAFDTFALTWTLSPFSVRASLPAVVALDHEGDQVYFSETIPNQLWEEKGSGFGTFDPNMSVQEPPSINTTNPNQILPGYIIRYPRWGIRIHCEKLPDPEINIVTKSPANMTYMFIPQNALSNLFTSFNMEFPDKYKQPLNVTKTMVGNDTVPEEIDVNAISLGAIFYDNGVAHSLPSAPFSMGDDGKGWISIESVLVRMNTTYAPNGKFGKYHNETIPDKDGKPTRVGFDGAICLELFEPWITQTKIPSFGLPSTDSIIARGYDLNITGGVLKKGHRSIMDTVNSTLSSKGKAIPYTIAHQNSVNQILKDNGRDAFYVSSPTTVSYTDGSGAYGYTELSAESFAHSRALADASNLLPYLAGSSDLVARSFADRVSSSAAIEPRWMAIFITVYASVGFFAAVFVPKLPLGIPRRGFEVYSWMAAFKANEVVLEGDMNMSQRMTLEEIGKKMGDLRVRHVA